jgi:hypothetical protein
MGVKRFLKFLTDGYESLSEVREVKRGSNVLFDSNAFFMELNTEVERRILASPQVQISLNVYNVADIMGGDLQPFRSALIHLVSRLISVFGVTPIFAVDGPQGVLQGDTAREAKWAARETQRKSEQAALENGAARPPQQQRERQLMFSLQAYATLASLGVAVVQLDDEVDRYIGALFHRHNISVAVTNDTDFVVIPDIPTVLLQHQFPWGALLDGWSPPFLDEATSTALPGAPGRPKTLTLRVFTMEALMERVSLRTHEEMWMAASLCGNDLTCEAVIRYSRKGTPFNETIEQTADRVRGVDLRRFSAAMFDLNPSATSLLQQSVKWYEDAGECEWRTSLTGESAEAFQSLVVSQKWSTRYFILWRDQKFVEDVSTKAIRTLMFAAGCILCPGAATLTFWTSPCRSLATIKRAKNSIAPDVCRLVQAAAQGQTREEKWNAIAAVCGLPDAILSENDARRMPPAVWLLLWIVKDGADPTMLPRVYQSVVEMMVLLYMSRAPQPPVSGIICRLIASLTQRHQAQRPSVASIRVAQLFAAAYVEVSGLLTLFSIADALPQPADLFSGSLLHMLLTSPHSAMDLMAASAQRAMFQPVISEIATFDFDRWGDDV